MNTLMNLSSIDLEQSTVKYKYLQTFLKDQYTHITEKAFNGGCNEEW